VHGYGPGGNGDRRLGTNGASPIQPRLGVFVFIKGKLAGMQYETPEDLFCEVKRTIEGIPPNVLRSVFESWKRRLLDCWNSVGEYVASTIWHY
jgi:hypothetical protein